MALLIGDLISARTGNTVGTYYLSYRSLLDYSYRGKLKEEV
jgi:hypothetical protein